MHWTDEIEIISNHYEATLVLNGWKQKVPGTYGKKTTKDGNKRVRDSVHNKFIAETWVALIRKGGTRLNPAFEKAYEIIMKKRLNERCALMSH
jgi:hypothetical protein